MKIKTNNSPLKEKINSILKLQNQENRQQESK